MKLRISGLLAIAAVVAAALGQSRAADLTTLFNFCGTDELVLECPEGSKPFAGLILDANGNLFGSTTGGGALSDGFGPTGPGTVFEIAKTATGYASTPTTLVSFSGEDDAGPFGSLILDANDNLFGATAGGGAYGYGTVFEIVKTSGGYVSTPTTLVSFNGTNGAYPLGGLIADANGNLFGTTVAGGTYGYGTVFEIAKTVGDYASTPTTLVNFNGTNGAFPEAGLIADADGNLFGTTSGFYYGPYGSVFEIAKTAGGYASTPTTLVSFCSLPNCSDGARPYGGLIADANGNLFGTTSGAYDAAYGGYGTVFEIAKTPRGYSSTSTTLVSFNGTNGAYPLDGVILDANGNLFGTTSDGGAASCSLGDCGLGMVFEIAKIADGYASTPTTLINFCSPPNCAFNGTNGARPYAGLIADTNGNLFGTTIFSFGFGTVFEITGSGFVPPGIFAGTPRNANCHGKSVSALAQKYGDLDAAAAALGYSSVSILLNDLAVHCGG